MNNGRVFHNKLLPDPLQKLTPDSIKFTKEYFIKLHYNVASFGTYNHLGARISLEHTQLKVQKFRDLLPTGYDDIVILQYIEFGFPLGLQEDFILKPVLKNHSSSYEFYTHVDKFIKNELEC